MRKVIIILLVLMLFSCAKQPSVEVCQKPYIQWKIGECCLDVDSNNICDFHETLEVVEEKEVVVSDSPLIEFLQVAPETYWFSTYDTGKVIVNNDKRHSIVSIDRGYTDIYWDISKEKAWKLCDMQREIAEIGKSFEIENAICNPNSLDIQELSSSEYKSLFPFGPVDWMKQYFDIKPLKVETMIQTIGVRTISPVIHFSDGKVLKFDYYFKVPVVVDMYEDNFRFKSIKYLFDTDFYIMGLDSADVVLPTDSPSLSSLIHISIKEAKPLLSSDILVQGIVTNEGSEYIPPQKIYIECYDKEGKMIGSKETFTFEGITAYKESEFKTYIPVSNKNLGRCKAELV